MPDGSLRPVIVRVMWGNRGRALTTAEIYDLVGLCCMNIGST